jgi:quinol monooxygenase YgiN
LLVDPAQGGRHLTIDRWTDRASYERFLGESAEAYDALDASLEGLATREVPIGHFDDVDG